MLLYVLKLNQNAKMPEAYGKYYAYPVITQTVGIDGLAEHMASHNTPFSKGAIKGMITDMVSCIKESAKTINLGATLKKASALLGDGTTPDTTPDTGKDTGKDTPGGENTDQGGSGTTGEGGGDGLE